MPELFERTYAQFIGPALQEMRLKRGMLQKDVASCLGCKQFYISKIENGFVGISIGKLGACCKIYRCMPSQIIARAESLAAAAKVK